MLLQELFESVGTDGCDDFEQMRMRFLTSEVSLGDSWDWSRPLSGQWVLSPDTGARKVTLTPEVETAEAR